MQRGGKDRNCKWKVVLPQSLNHGYRRLDRFPDPSCCICVFQGFFLSTNWFKDKHVYFSKSFCLLVYWISKESSFSQTISRKWYKIPRKTVFTLSLYTVKKFCSKSRVFWKNVKIRTTYTLKNCINFPHRTYMIILSQHWDNLFVFLYNSSCKFSYGVSIYNF